MRRAQGGMAVLLLVASCTDRSKIKDDAGTDGAVAEALDASLVPVPVPVPAMLASNQGDIARFTDETPIASTPNTAQRTFSVREAPPSGAVVGQLSKGTVVTQLASRGPYVLILFEMRPGSQVMGWVHRDAFSASIPDAGVPTCTAGETALFSDGPVCGKVCVVDAECGAGQACTGSGNKLAAGNKPGDAVKVCTAFVVHDGGVAPSAGTVDGGDAKDAGVNAPAQDVVSALAGNKCPANFVFLAKTGKCHRPCPGGPGGKECKNQPFYCSTKCGASMLCTESRDQCVK